MVSEHTAEAVRILRGLFVVLGATGFYLYVLYRRGVSEGKRAASYLVAGITLMVVGLLGPLLLVFGG